MITHHIIYNQSASFVKVIIQQFVMSILLFAGSDRSHWIYYDENMSARHSWAQDLLNAFKEEVRKVRDIMTTPPTSPGHKPVTPTDQVSC